MQDQSARSASSTLTSKISSEQMVRLPHCPSFQGFVEQISFGGGEFHFNDVLINKFYIFLISDYDFSDAKGNEFSKEQNFQTVINSVDNLLSVTAMDQYAKARHALWATLNEEIDLPDCDIFSYTPDLTSDPFAEDGCLWSFNYFFYNRKKKRVVLFTCRAQSPFSGNHSWFDVMEEDDFED